MPRRSLRRSDVEDRATQQALDAVREYTRQLDMIPWLDGVLAENLTFASSGDKLVAHGLGRVPRGVRVEKWIQSSAGDAPRVVEAPGAHTLTLNVSAACTVTLWVW